MNNDEKSWIFTISQCFWEIWVSKVTTPPRCVQVYLEQPVGRRRTGAKDGGAPRFSFQFVLIADGLRFDAHQMLIKRKLAYISARESYR